MENTKDNIWKAIAVSLGVAFAGAVIWGLLYTYGWFVGIVAYVASLLMLKMFNKFYSKECKWKYAYVLGVIIVFNIIASFLSLVVYCSHELNISFGVAFEALIETMSAYIVDFIIDMIIGCVCAVLGIVSAIKLDKRNAGQSYEMQGESASNLNETNNIESNQETSDSQEPAVRFCENCGTKLAPGESKCSSCGADVNKD